VRAGRSTFTLPALPTADFPAISGDALNHSFTLAAAELKSLIDRTRFAISTEETRYYLNGIFLHATRSKRHRGDARGRDRWPSPRAGRDAGARRRVGHARRDPAAQDRRRAAQADRGDRQPGRDLAVRHARALLVRRRGAELES